MKSPLLFTSRCHTFDRNRSTTYQLHQHFGSFHPPTRIPTLRRPITNLPRPIDVSQPTHTVRAIFAGIWLRWRYHLLSTQLQVLAHAFLLPLDSNTTPPFLLRRLRRRVGGELRGELSVRFALVDEVLLWMIEWAPRLISSPDCRRRITIVTGGCNCLRRSLRWICFVRSEVRWGLKKFCSFENVIMGVRWMNQVVFRYVVPHVSVFVAPEIEMIQWENKRDVWDRERQQKWGISNACLVAQKKFVRI